MKDLVGQQFFRLTVIAREENDEKGNNRWLCRCNCGAVKILRGNNLRSGSTKSCGCWRSTKGPEKHTTKHGKWGSRTWVSWNSARTRCRNPNTKDYPRYGGRGITFSPLWDDFEVFFAEMGERPPGHSLDRIDNSKGYEPGNCRWATAKEQANNRRDNRRSA